MIASGSIERAQLELVQNVVEAVYSISQHLRSIDLPAKLTPERLMLLTFVGQYEPISISELANLAQVTVPTISRMVSALSGGGLVERTDDESDGRGVVVSLTPKGRRVYRSANRIVWQELSQALGRLSSREVSALTSLVTKLACIR